DVVDEGVAPDIDDVPLVTGKRDAPGDRGARDAEVPEARLEPAQDLVSARLGLDELGVLFDVLLQPVLVAGEGEEVVVLLQPAGLDRRMDPAVTVVQLALLVKGLAGRTVPAAVSPLVDVAPGLDGRDQLLDARHVVGILGPD